LAVVDDDLVDTKDEFIVYSSESGKLFYNQNGIAAGLGTGAAFVDLFNQPTTLTPADFIVRAEGLGRTAVRPYRACPYSLGTLIEWKRCVCTGERPFAPTGDID
jgi:hypothetical protein